MIRDLNTSRLEYSFCRFSPIGLTAAVLVCAHLAVLCHAEETPIAQVADRIKISPPLGAKLPLDLPFIDADGHTVRLGDSFGDRPVILHLVYYECPMLCKLSSDGLLRALSTLSLKPGEDFSIVTVSFDPREGPELSARARRWRSNVPAARPSSTAGDFLTGDEAAIAKLCEAVGFRYMFDEKTGQFAHASACSS